MWTNNIMIIIFLIKKTISFIEVVFLMLVLKIYEKYKLGDMTKEECKKLFKYNIRKCFREKSRILNTKYKSIKSS